MASSSDDNFVIIVCRNSDNDQLEPESTHEEILLSTNDILSWDLSTILRHRIVKVKAHRRRLAEQSSYFHGLLCGNFSESSLENISVEWNLETLLSVLKCIYGCPLVVSSKSLLPLLEAALYFGVEALLVKCKTWFSEVTSSNMMGVLQIELDDLINLWMFGSQHALSFFPELCTSYLARKFMCAVPDQCFLDIPYALLLSCLEHPHLTVDSEMHLAEAVLIWIHGNLESVKCGAAEDDCINILRHIHVSLLPLWFIAEKRRSRFFSALANQCVQSICKNPSVDLMDILEDGDLSGLRIRLTEFSEVVNLSSCPQMTTTILLLSLLPSSYIMDPLKKRSVRQCVQNLKGVDRDCHLISRQLLPVLTFEAVHQVDISKCSMLHIGAAIECFSKSFPSLRILKAAYVLKFKTNMLLRLMHKCPLLCEVDLTCDISPLIPLQFSVGLLSPEVNENLTLIDNGNNVQGGTEEPVSPYHSGFSPSNLTRLTLEGRHDVFDSDLIWIATSCVSLCHLNLKGCTSVTDTGISNLISKCFNLHSIIACDTSFGNSSVQALCHGFPIPVKGNLSTFGSKINSVADKLQRLHIGGCKGIDRRFLLQLVPRIHSVKSLCLRDSQLDDPVLSSFGGSSLESLNVSNTMVSGPYLAILFLKNPGLKILKARGCKNLVQQEWNNEMGVLPRSLFCEGLITLSSGSSCRLEEIALGWGFCSSSLEALSPAIASLKKLTVGLGGTLGEDALRLLPTSCPLLESLTLYFQFISDGILLHIITSLMHLQVLSLCFCLGEISISSFNFAMPYLRKLNLQRVAPWMTDDDLLLLAKNCESLTELSLLGCRLLTSDVQKIISSEWPGLISLHLEDCGEVTVHGISSLLDCVALEDLLLRHNGPGIPRNFILDAISKLPMLRMISLDTCDANEGGFDIPKECDTGHPVSTIKVARCEQQIKSLDIQFVKPCRRPVHRDTLLLLHKGGDLTRTVVKERL